MVKSRLFWKIFITFAVLTLVAAMILVAVLTRREREVIVERIEQRLHDSAVLLRNDMQGVFDSGLDPEVQATLVRLGKQTGTRLTLVAEDGLVLGDSDEDPATMENHRDRPELLQARTKGYGVSQRPSPTLGIPMMYVALRVGEEGSPAGFVRVAMPMETLEAQVALVQQVILLTAVMVSLALLVASYLIVGRIIKPLATLTQAAESIAGGNIQQEVNITNRDELGNLAKSFNLMSRQLAGRISELDRKGREFAENSERLEAVLGGMVEGVLAVDGDERILFANRAVRSMLEFALPSVVGRPVWEAVRNPTIQEVIRRALKTRTQKHLELEIPRTHSTVELSAARLPGDPCPGAILVLHDVTELRRLENVRQQFVSNVSHELKTPLSSIHAYTETLLEGAVDDPTHNREFLRQIKEQADRLHLLILDLLRLAQIESDEGVPVPTAVSLGETVGACIEEHEGVASAKQVTLNVHPGPADLCALADEEALRTILDNLVENAINYTPEGGEVVIRWHVQDSTAVLEVVDTGIGIAEEHRGRIFERFYRVDKARSRQLGGTGLGLSIVKHLVLQSEGTIEVASQPGKGSTFTVCLPLP